MRFATVVSYEKMAKLNFSVRPDRADVQVWLPDDARLFKPDSYSRNLPACRVHLCQQTSGRTLGDKEVKCRTSPKRSLKCGQWN